MNSAKGIKPINLYPVEPMSKDTGQIMTNLLFNRELGKQMYEDVKEEFAVKMCEKRCEVFNVKLDKATLIFISCVLSKNPAMIVQYVHAIYHSQVGALDVFSMTDLCELFPDGFPTDASMQAAWIAQKIPATDRSGMIGDNTIDIPAIFRTPYTA